MSEPLASRLRPDDPALFAGQSHLLGPGQPLEQAFARRAFHSMILWGPPGTGKTTLARMVAAYSDMHFVSLSAVLAGVKDIREAVQAARDRQALEGRGTILFVDEVHRFNKAQQDAFLPHIEDGTVLFIGATTENPAFELNNALLSRVRVYVLKALEPEAIFPLLQRGARYLAEAGSRVTFTDAALQRLADRADGDARRALNWLEQCEQLASRPNETVTVDETVLGELIRDERRHRFDKQGDVFYDQISALHKALRGSAPDAALYWFVRMLEGGCDPLYLARRLVRMASEDVGNADPRALRLALDAWETQERLGSPEGELAIAQAVVYLAVAPKSNAVYRAFNQACRDVRETPDYPVPPHIRNAPTDLARSLGHGEDYRYAHDEGGYAPGECYFPEALRDRRYYEPVAQGLEIRIREKLERLRQLDRESGQSRYPDKE